ncbi:hypothetical protein [Nocardia sp. BMG111209]|uniref:hypothetical protein n=1 Tax=Nocardia sp. BMG111209 TaxID=1160137 RepID=UPI0003A288D1|nr:hypothetical protein [Nocardia sp. BMG111209]
MTHHHRTIIRIGLAAVLAAGAGAAVSGCAHPAVRAPSPVGGGEVISRVDPRAADPLITAALATVYSWNPGTDPDTSAGFIRAAAFLEPAYAREVGVTGSGLASVTTTTWARWTVEHATITATAVITSDDHPADTLAARHRVAAITQHVASSSSSEPDRTLTVYVTAEDTPDGWRVSLIAPR